MDLPAVGASLSEHVTALALSAHVSACCFLEAQAAFALGDGRVVLAGPDGARRESAPHEGAVLAAANAAGMLLTGGDDGRLVRTRADGTSDILAEEGGRWIDAVAAAPSGAVAWSAGRAVRARDAAGTVKTFAPPSSVRGLAFAPKGYRLAVAHNGGASLWFPNATAEPDRLEWKGSHIDVTWSPDGRFVVTSMQENALHGWRVVDRRHMRMTGYPGKSRSLSWTHDGKWLATSGAEACILWPFADKDGPMGKAPRECAVRRARVGAVACHPRAPVVAIGYDDGCILLGRLGDGAELLVRRQSRETGQVTCLAWDDEGARLAFGTGAGAAGWLDLPAAL